jgi:dihydropteroate synthase
LAKIGRLEIGRSPAKVMGIINASPESFYKGSVKTEAQDISAAAKAMQEAGAYIIDIGGMSTAPYLETVIPVDEEIRRLENAISAIKSACDLPVSVDTPRAEVAEAAIKLGVDAVNDVTGLKYDRRMAKLVAGSGLPVIIGAYSKRSATGKLAGTIRALKESIALARKAGVKKDAIIIDPSIGFFRAEGKNPFFTKMADVPWYTRDLEVLANLHALAKIAPVCVSVSRKSFLGHLFGVKADERLIPSIACEVIAAINGAGIIRTHNVKETVQALVMQELLAR